MFEIVGKHGLAKVFAKDYDESAIKQIYGILASPISKDANVRIMPDYHAGAGCVIGTTMKIGDKVCPNIVGVDIGCGVLTIELGKASIDLEKLDNFIKREIPSGFSVGNSSSFYTECLVNELRCFKDIKNLDRIYKSMGSLGGGNHFVEIDKDDDNNKYLLIHTGSRNLGLQVAKYYQDKATKKISDSLGSARETLIHENIKALKEAGLQESIPHYLENEASFKRTWNKDLDFLVGEDMDDYLHDMFICQQFARDNRRSIAEKILDFLSIEDYDYFDTIHNYIDTKSKVLRKGAVSAEKQERLIIPINMRDGALVCIGRGNLEWNCSAPHGAGRILSRSEAKRQLTEDQFKDTMEGIYTSTATIDTIDESPMAYKPIENIIGSIGDTVEIVKTIKPIYNFKAN
jgi:RNA-splicing ligase RtcB